MARQLALRCSQVVAVQGWLELQSLEDLPAGPDVPASSLTCPMVMLLDGSSGGLLGRALWYGFSSTTDWGGWTCYRMNGSGRQVCFCKQGLLHSLL